ncbi:MAG: SDR family oxidoreductase [Rhodobacter sp.]|nr:SDR family oxidoreductase [Paracoccaceae bacterium]MCC0076574.1 SDR family oxidoreductase [Rhodobacter sp.]
MSRIAITGAAAGIGRAIAQHCAAQGAQTLLIDRDVDRAEALAATLPGAGHAVLGADLADAAARAALVGQIETRFGGLDALVLNAGVTDSSGAGFAQTEAARIALLQAVNLAAPLDLASRLAPAMPRGAQILTVASGAGLRALPFRGAYSPTKAGLIAATQALAGQLTPSGIAVAGLAPGFVRTDLVDSLIAAGRLDPHKAVAKVPLGRMATPDEIATAALFLLRAPELSGQVLAVDGGSSAFGGSAVLADPTPAPTLRPGVTVLGDTDVARTFAGNSAGAGVFDTQAGGDLDALHTLAARHLPRLAETGGALVILTDDEAGTDPARAARAAARRMAAQVLACEWGRRGVRVNALQVGPHATPRALARAARFLLSADAAYVTGAALAVGLQPM